MGREGVRLKGRVGLYPTFAHVVPGDGGLGAQPTLDTFVVNLLATFQGRI